MSSVIKKEREENMDFDIIIRIIEVCILPLLWWVIHEVGEIKKDLYEFKSEVEKEFSRKEDIIRIENKFDSLYQLILDRLPKRGK